MAKRKSLLIYGEKTVLAKSRRIPESKKNEIEKRIDELLAEYYNPKSVKSVFIRTKKAKSLSQEENFKLAMETAVVKIKGKAVVDKDSIQLAEPVNLPAYEKLTTLPLGTSMVTTYGSKGAIRQLDDVYFTKRQLNGGIEIIKHLTYTDAFEYAEANFK